MKLRAQPLERLVDAEPAWVGERGAGGLREGVGVSFDCPIHEDCHLGAPFKNPLDGQGPPGWKALDGTQWTRSGDTFETLTLSPSIHMLGEKDDPPGCQWHGFIRAGRFETCGDSR